MCFSIREIFVEKKQSAITADEEKSVIKLSGGNLNRCSVFKVQETINNE